MIHSDADFTPEVISTAQVIVMSNLTGSGRINEETKAFIPGWVTEGGGIFALHGN